MRVAVVVRAVLAVVTAVCLVIAVAQARMWSIYRSYDAAPLPICRVATNAPVVALSFDDGPNPRFTRPILALLRRTGARATFFAVGSRAAARPDLVREEVAASMEVENHTWAHPHLGSLDPAALRSELDRTDAALVAATGFRPHLFRPPFGEIDPAELGIVRDAGLRPIGWSVAADRYLDPGYPPGETARAVAADVRAGDIILAHDAGADRSSTVEMLAPLLARLHAEGYRVVTVGELLALGQAVRARPDRWFWQSGFSCPR